MEFLIQKSYKNLLIIIFFSLLNLSLSGAAIYFAIKAEGYWLIPAILVISIFLFYKILMFYVKWRFSYIVVDESKLEHFSRSGLFKENLTSIDLKNISDVSYNQSGLVNIIFGSGIIILRTNSGEFRFHDVRSIKQAYAKLNDIISHGDSSANELDSGEEDR